MFWCKFSCTSTNCRWSLEGLMRWRSPIKGRDCGPGGKFFGFPFFKTLLISRKIQTNIKILRASKHCKPRTLYTASMSWFSNTAPDSALPGDLSHNEVQSAPGFQINTCVSCALPPCSVIKDQCYLCKRSDKRWLLLFNICQ